LDCRFYRTGGGSEPVREWLWSLDTAARKRIGHDILRVQWQWPVSRPLVGSFGKGLYEVRTSVGAREFRVFFCVTGGFIVLLHGLQKKTRATLASDVALARRRMTEENDA